MRADSGAEERARIRRDELHAQLSNNRSRRNQLEKALTFCEAEMDNLTRKLRKLERDYFEQGYIDAARNLLVLKEGGIQEEPEPQPEIIDQNALFSYGISYGQSRGMIYTPSLPSEIHGYDPPSDFMLWVTSMEEAKAKVRECIDCTVDNILSLEPGTSPSDIRFYVCFNSSNQFVVMYG